MSSLSIKYPYWRRADHVVWKVIDEKGILLNLETGAYFEVNPVGLALWKRFDGKTNIDRAVLSVAKAFDAKPTRVAKDASFFCGELKRKKIVDVSKTPFNTVASLS